MSKRKEERTMCSQFVKRIVVGTVILVWIFAGGVQADVFSLASLSPSIGGNIGSADLLAPGPNVHVPGGNLGLLPGDEIDALSAGSDIVTGNDIIFFSVDRYSCGLQGPAFPYDVAGQSGLGQQAGDIFVTMNLNYVQSAPVGYNYLDVNQHEFGLVPAGSIGFPDRQYSGDIDNLDAYSMEEFDFNADGVPDVPVYFSLAAGSPTLATLGASPADILVWAPGVGLNVFLSASQLGLDSGGDDIDALALEIIGGNIELYFSLTPNSASGLGADIYYSNAQGWNTVAFPASVLGLLGMDNVDALETNAVPEPVTILLIMLGLVELVRKKK